MSRIYSRGFTLPYIAAAVGIAILAGLGSYAYISLHEKDAAADDLIESARRSLEKPDRETIARELESARLSAAAELARLDSLYIGNLGPAPADSRRAYITARNAILVRTDPILEKFKLSPDLAKRRETITAMFKEWEKYLSNPPGGSTDFSAINDFVDYIESFLEDLAKALPDLPSAGGGNPAGAPPSDTGLPIGIPAEEIGKAIQDIGNIGAAGNTGNDVNDGNNSGGGNSPSADEIAAQEDAVIDAQDEVEDLKEDLESADSGAGNPGGGDSNSGGNQAGGSNPGGNTPPSFEDEELLPFGQGEEPELIQGTNSF